MSSTPTTFSWGAGLLALALLLPTPSQAGNPSEVEPGFGFHGVGVNLGLGDVEGDTGSTIMFGGHANMGAPFEGVPQLALIPRIMYWTKSVESGVSGGDDFSFSEFSFIVDGRYYFPMAGAIGVFAGGGIGFHRSSFDIPSVSAGGFTVGGGSVSETDIGITLLGGGEVELSETIDGSAEARLKFGGFDEFMALFGFTMALGGE
jgi:opacity protein-like surface antigen